jgi:hypothetical protein
MSSIALIKLESGAILMCHPLIPPVYLDHGVPIKWGKFLDWDDELKPTTFQPPPHACERGPEA